MALIFTACGPGPDTSLAADAAAVETDGRAGADAAATAFADAVPAQVCGTLDVTFRDFSATHPDFESFTGDEVFPGIVQDMLGGDGKPVYAPAGPTPHTTGPAEFAQWYRDVPGINVRIEGQLELTESAPNVYVYESDAFFPVDAEGFGNEGRAHNFHFTTELHTRFRYDGGEVFTFYGDDDLWLFVNGRLAIDLGGLHQAAERTVDLDAIAAAHVMTPGNTYDMAIFHAERHTVESNFRIETTIECFYVP